MCRDVCAQGRAVEPRLMSASYTAKVTQKTHTTWPSAESTMLCQYCLSSLALARCVPVSKAMYALQNTQM